MARHVVCDYHYDSNIIDVVHVPQHTKSNGFVSNVQVMDWWNLLTLHLKLNLTVIFD